MTRAEMLRAHIEEAHGAPVIGVNDCGPWVIRWAEKAGGRSIGFPPYKSREEAFALTKEAGGFVKLADGLMAGAGFFTTTSPDLGDVAVIRLSDRDTAAIFCEGGLVAVRGEFGGVSFLRPATVLKAWHVPEPEK